VDLAYIRLQNAEIMVAYLQMQLGLKSRWKIGGAEYLQYKVEAAMGKYCEVLDEVERLVVMRLFELSKLSMSGTGTRLMFSISQPFSYSEQDISSVNKSARVFNANQQPFARQLSSTIP
jgi:hypothetical protein